MGYIHALLALAHQSCGHNLLLLSSLNLWYRLDVLSPMLHHNTICNYYFIMIFFIIRISFIFLIALIISNCCYHINTIAITKAIITYKMRSGYKPHLYYHLSHSHLFPFHLLPLYVQVERVFPKFPSMSQSLSASGKSRENNNVPQ